jgi:L-ascorbate metabolism protein UlaG (beta-lactamase superfamily)
MSGVLLTFVVYKPTTMKYRMLFLAFCFVAAKSFSQRAAADIIPTARGPLTVQPVTHASLVLSLKELVIYVDPSGAAKFKGLPAPDMILITDIHGDHFDTSTLAVVMTPNTVLVVPQVVADKLPASYDKSRVVVMKNGDQVNRSGITITATPMYNLPESPTAMHTKGRGNGYVLNIGGKNIYLSGDTQGIPEMRSLQNIDVAFVCMNLPYTMDVKEAADAVLAFRPKIVYPYHYRGKGGLSDVNEFKSLVNAGNKGIEVRLRDWYPAN